MTARMFEIMRGTKKCIGSFGLLEFFFSLRTRKAEVPINGIEIAEELFQQLLFHFEVFLNM